MRTVLVPVKERRRPKHSVVVRIRRVERSQVMSLREGNFIEKDGGGDGGYDSSQARIETAEEELPIKGPLFLTE